MTIVNEVHPRARDEASPARREADQMVLREVLTGLQAATSPAAAVDVVLDLAMGLCAPLAAGYLPESEPARFHPASTTEDIDVTAAFAAVSERPWGRSGDVVAIRVGDAGAQLGALVIISSAHAHDSDDCVDVLLPACESLGRTLSALGALEWPDDVVAEAERATADVETQTVAGTLTRGSALDLLEQWRTRCLTTGTQLHVTVVSLDGNIALRAQGRLAEAESAQRAGVEQLRRLVRRADLIGQLGGDSFLMARILQPDSTSDLADKIQDAFAGPWPVGRSGPETLDVSVGSASTDLVGGDAENLVAAAEAARVRNARIHTLATGLAAPQQAESLWQGAINALVDGVIVQDIDGRIVAHNPAAESILGLPGSALSGQAASDEGWHAIHPDGAPFPPHTMPGAVALRTGRPVSDVVMGVCIPGSPVKWVNTSAVPLGTPSEPGTAAVVSTLTDQTPTIRAHHGHAAGYSRLRQAIDAVPHPFFILDAERDRHGRIVELRYAHVNLAVARLYGCRVEDVIGRGQIELFPSVVANDIFSRYVAVIETGVPDTIEIPWFDDNGVRGSFEVQASPLGDSIVLTATEISERMALVSRLAASEAQFLSTFGDVAVPMALIREPIGTGTRIVVQVNASMCHFLGHDEAALLGPVSDTTPPALGRVLRDFDQLCMTATNITPLECRLRDESGHSVWAEVRLSELEDTVPGSHMWLLQCSDTTQRHVIEHELAYATHHDQLTGLPNMAGFITEVANALDDMSATQRPVAVMVLNLDDFKSVNVELGLDAGNAYLGQFSRLLAESTGPDDQVSRLGGDEFAILLRDVKDRRNLGARAGRTLELLTAGIDLEGTRISTPASIGGAIATPRSTPETLLSAATAAMREAKVRGGHRWTLAAAPRVRTHSILKIEAELRDAISVGALDQRYQPLYNLRTGRLDSVEALARWSHPTHGFIPPEEFITIAERRNLIGALGDWALDTACAQWSRWRDEYGHQAPAVAVNVSTRQLGQRRVARRLQALLASFDMPADQIWLEVTESQAVEAEGPATQELAAIREMGAHVSIDDFGTGFAGFGYLRSLSADGLKLDKSFIDDVHTNRTAAAVATSMVSLGHGLGLTVIAEGIETQSQLAVMSALGADIGQGWLWSHARAASDIDKLIGLTESEVRS